MTDDSLDDCAASVVTRDDFVRFVNRLNKDYRHGEWENDDLESFLSGLAGFTTDIAGFYKDGNETVDVEVLTWRMAAQMLLAATGYE